MPKLGMRLHLTLLVSLRSSNCSKCDDTSGFTPEHKLSSQDGDRLVCLSMTPALLTLHLVSLHSPAAQILLTHWHRIFYTMEGKGRHRNPHNHGHTWASRCKVCYKVLGSIPLHTFWCIVCGCISMYSLPVNVVKVTLWCTVPDTQPPLWFIIFNDLRFLPTVQAVEEYATCNTENNFKIKFDQVTHDNMIPV